MCIAIYQSIGHRLPKEQLVQSWKSNPDGAGISYFNENGELVIEKDMELDGILYKYERAVDRYASTSPFAVHFRIATHGGVNIDNCHPFRVSDDTVLIHNGIIPVMFDSKKDPRSDTRVFVDEYLPKLPANWMDDEHLFDMVETYIGNSKLVILSRAGDHDAYIANESAGHWSTKGEFWYSNASYKTASKMVWASDSKQLALGCDIIQDEYDNSPLPECYMCGEPSVFDEMCYTCESCQRCYQEDEHCLCDAQFKVHSMTDNEYRNGAWYM
jgi:predicted glutamine amidotransferase